VRNRQTDLVDWLFRHARRLRGRCPVFICAGGCLLACHSKHKQTRSVSEGLRLSIASLADASGYYRSLAYASGCCRSLADASGCCQRPIPAANRGAPAQARRYENSSRGRARGSANRQASVRRHSALTLWTADFAVRQCSPTVCVTRPAVINVCVEHST